MSDIEKFEDFLDKMQELLDNAKKQGHIIVRTEDLKNIFSELNESKDKSKPNGAIVWEDCSEGDGFYKVNLNYLNKEQVEEIEGLVEKWNPELKESKDEKIRKSLISILKSDFEKDTTIYDISVGDIITWLEKQGKETRWKPSKEEMDVLYGLAYITNQYDEHKEEVITRLYQDLKREFFNGSSYENMFPNTEDAVRRRSTIQVLEYARSLDNYNQFGKADIDKNIAWLEKQGEQKPNYCHHEVDLSNCSDEYRKAYYDGWNNCNMQHSQCKSDGNAVVKCLINGLNFYYERDEEAYWGTAKFPMKIKDILSWLQKQLETN